MAAFAFRLAREATGNQRPTYTRGAGSRNGLILLPEFKLAFSAAKDRIRGMKVQFVEENDPIRQSLLEIYVAVALTTPYTASTIIEVSQGRSRRSATSRNATPFRRKYSDRDRNASLGRASSTRSSPASTRFTPFVRLNVALVQ
jgi:hypothetical protein